MGNRSGNHSTLALIKSWSPRNIMRTKPVYIKTIQSLIQNEYERYLLFTFLLFFTLFIIIPYSEINYGWYNQNNPHPYAANYGNQDSYLIQKYLINTPNCKIPDVDPFIEEVKGFYQKEEYMQCSEHPLLSYIEKTNNSISLNINKTRIPLYSFFQIHCCYSKVVRDRNLEEPDDRITISDCISFSEAVIIEDPIIKVSCYNRFSKEVYSNIHAIISPDDIPHRKNYDLLAKSNSTPSVLLVGIDSISKLNLVRTMPKTYTFLENKDFVNLKGYTKIGLNTLPNLIGMFAGLTREQMEEICDLDNDVDNCPIIWKKFHDAGYVTGYGEDSTHISSFNYEKKGFSNPPTDFYFRPYILASESIGIQKKENMFYCAGPETEGERIMNLAKDFQIALKNYPKFGVFWMNSFSHDGLNVPSSMDERVEEFLSDIYQHLDNTILFFFSDHGFRFGELRTTETGWLEERIPFFYVHFPDTFKNNFPKEYNDFVTNSGRLTNAFDIYMTLQHILHLADPNYSIQPSEACPKCHSLFEEVSEGRSCHDAAIADDWCVCYVRAYVSPEKPLVKRAAHFLVDKINKLIENYSQGYKCRNYRLNKILYSGISQIITEQNQVSSNLLLRIRTVPNAIFEGSVEIRNGTLESGLRILGDISRLDRYAPYSFCVKDSSLERYCYCNEYSELSSCWYLFC